MEAIRLSPSRMRHARAALGMVLAGIGLQAAAALPQPPLGFPDRGVLRLQLGTSVQGDHQPRRFLHQPSGSVQSISNVGKCGYQTGGPQLAVLTATGGLGEVGLGPDSIGVANGPKGVACYRITASVGEVLAFGLGAAAVNTLHANAFYRLELDVEVKSNAEFVLEILQGGSVTATYRLRTGSSIVAGEGSYDADAGASIYNCTAQSDSGPDSGANDNCRWKVNELGQSFRLVPVAGEGSLEGGGDFGSAAYANETLVYLTEGEIGALGCESLTVPESTDTNTIGDGVNDASCQVTRINPTGLGGTCTTAIGYVFRNLPGSSEGCELIKSPGEQLAASIQITFPPETAVSLGSEPATKVYFSNGSGGLVEFTPPRCSGTVVNDSNGNPTILEVLSGGSVGYDVVFATPSKDWACVLDNRQEYLGGGLMQVIQTILFWGDIAFSRG